MKTFEATEAMEIIALLAEGDNCSVAVCCPKSSGWMVEAFGKWTKLRYRHFRGETPLDALRKARAAWEEGKK